MEFDRWKDYFALALLVPKMARERSCAQQPPKPVYVPAFYSGAKEVPGQIGNAAPRPILARKHLYVPGLYPPAEEDASFLSGKGNYAPKPFAVPATYMAVEEGNTVQMMAAEMGNCLPEAQWARKLTKRPACATGLHLQQRANKTSPVALCANANPHGKGRDSDVQSRVCPEEQGATESFCHFCKHNGESGRVYTTHTLRDSRGSVICPVLWKYTCPLCGATGDLSHTLRYCPFNDNKSCLYSKSGRNSSGRLLRQ
ncbi:hypothetical protein XENTR_v10004464 [Xenopus tropicalis]|uniref:Nanos homolog 1-like n=1 Tax=Xenopus tropicalis TaxID=8364 RepID=A0A8J0R8D8_XENTR|nr:nanos homolog 1-like [Xenopus tropicalis]KAE8577189.1 hypothetical protein XENTR_v10004464 [Xenopus tropicalis]